MKVFNVWCSGTMPRSLLLVGFLLLCGCEQEGCAKEVGRDTAVQIARDYFLTRSIAQLEAGRPFEQQEAMRMRRAGMTEETYRETFERTVPDGPRRVGNQSCGHPLIYYQARLSPNYDGFEISFVRIIPDVDPRRWRATSTSLNITKCGTIGILFGTSTRDFFSEESNYGQRQREMGFDTCP